MIHLEELLRHNPPSHGDHCQANSTRPTTRPKDLEFPRFNTPKQPGSLIKLLEILTITASNVLLSCVRKLVSLWKRLQFDENGVHLLLLCLHFISLLCRIHCFTSTRQVSAAVLLIVERYKYKRFMSRYDRVDCSSYMMENIVI
jgi:hypothetical protein